MKTKRLLTWGVALFLGTSVYGSDITPESMKFATADALTVEDFDVKTSQGGNPDVAKASVQLEKTNRFFYWGMGNGAAVTPEKLTELFNLRNVEGYGRMLTYDPTVWSANGFANGWAGLSVFSSLDVPTMVSAGITGPFADATTQQKIDATVRVSILFRCVLDDEFIDEFGNLKDGLAAKTLFSSAVQSSGTTVLGTQTDVAFGDFADDVYDEELFQSVYKYDPKKWVKLSWDIILNGPGAAPMYMKNSFTAAYLGSVPVEIKEVTFEHAPSDAAMVETKFGNPIKAVKEIKVIEPTASSIDAISGENSLMINFSNEQVEVYNVPAGELITVSSFNGAMVQQVISAGELTTILLPKGSYILVAGGKTAKVIL